MSSTIPKVTEWMRQIGYQGEIPETLDRIVTNSTSCIWEQLIQNAKPRQEVELIRKNVIVNRLQKKNISEQDEFEYPIPEIALYKKREKLQATKENLQLFIAEKEKKAEILSRENKLKYGFIQKSKAKTKANKERAFILQKKCLMLQTEIQEVDEFIITANNITPVEAEENCNMHEITEVLEECVKKLENTVTNIPTSYIQTPREVDRPSYSTLNSSKVNKLRCHKQLFSDNSQGIVNKRESLGLLHESCYEQSSFISSHVGTQSQDLIFEEEIDLTTFSIRKLYTSVDQYLGRKPTKGFLEKVCKDNTIHEKISELLHKHDRQLIWNLFQTLNINLHQSVVDKIFSVDENKTISIKIVNQDDISKLQAVHVQTELQVMKLEAVIRHLSLQVEKNKEYIKNALENSGLTHDRVDIIMNALNLHLKDIGLDASLVALKDELHLANSLESNSELQLLSSKLVEVKDSIASRVGFIKTYLNLSSEVLASIKRTCEETTACVRKLGRFVDDMAWSVPLTENVCSQEVNIFEDFPLEFNRKCTYTNPSVYYRDICIEVIPQNEEFDTDTLYMLNELLEDPLNPPETILLNLLKSKMKLEILQDLKNCNDVVPIRKYSFDELQKQESYLEFALDRLMSLNSSESAKKTLSISSISKETFDIWMKMPFKDFISNDRKVDGKPYEFYEKKFDGFYNNL